MLTREQILGINDTKVQEVSVPEWNGSVFVRVMTGGQRDILEAELRKPNPQNIRARLASFSICDDKGTLLFSEKDVVELSKKNYAALDRIVLAASSLNEITEEQIDELKKTLKETTS